MTKQKKTLRTEKQEKEKIKEIMPEAAEIKTETEEQAHAETEPKEAKTYFAIHGHYASRNSGSFDSAKASWHVTDTKEMPIRNPNTVYAAWFVFDEVKTFKTLKAAKAFVGEQNDKERKDK